MLGMSILIEANKPPVSDIVMLIVGIALLAAVLLWVK